MRIPVPLVISSCVLAAVVTWYFGTRHADFTKPPTKAEKEKIVRDWKADNESDVSLDLSKKTAVNTSEEVKKTQASTEKKTTESVKNDIPKIPLGDIEASPKLSEYGEFGDLGAQALIQLATDLEGKHANERALLAWERVLDSTLSNQTQIKQASEAIKKLKPSVGAWNPDPTSELTITLHAGSSTENKEALRDALDATAAVITEASGYILHVKTELSVKKKSNGIKLPRTPVAIWFTHSTTSPKRKIVKTPPLSFMADPSQKEMLANQFQAAVYALISAHMAETTNYAKFPEYPAGVTPDELLKYYVTRLMWREFVKSLQ